MYKEIKNERVKNFINEYFDLCRKYDLCISALPYDDYEITELSDYDYYDLDISDELLPVYEGMFMGSVLEHYDPWAWEIDEEDE